jgi:hypothetical protein
MKAKLFAVLAVLFTIAGVATLDAQNWGSGWCPTCYVASNVDVPSREGYDVPGGELYLGGWGFECGSGSRIQRVDVYYYDDFGRSTRIKDAVFYNGLWRNDVYKHFLAGGGCPLVPVDSGWAVYFPTAPPPGRRTIAIVLWHGWVSATHYRTVTIGS